LHVSICLTSTYRGMYCEPHDFGDAQAVCHAPVQTSCQRMHNSTCMWQPAGSRKQSLVKAALGKCESSFLSCMHCIMFFVRTVAKCIGLPASQHVSQPSKEVTFSVGVVLRHMKKRHAWQPVLQVRGRWKIESSSLCAEGSAHRSQQQVS
jgi:hypothetical protein